MEDRSHGFEQALLRMDRVTAAAVFREQCRGSSAIAAVETMLTPALERIGRDWEQGSVALSQVYMSGRICEELLDDALPPGEPGRKDHPTMALAVLEDYHLLGKRIVYAVLRGSGFALMDYGRMTVEEVVARVRQDGTRLLLISTLMLPSALRIKQVRTRLRESGCDVKIIVGGAPFRFDQQLYLEVGADAMATNASEAVEVVTRVLGEAP